MNGTERWFYVMRREPVNPPNPEPWSLRGRGLIGRYSRERPYDFPRELRMGLYVRVQ
jgi:hypothetical protein